MKVNKILIGAITISVLMAAASIFVNRAICADDQSSDQAAILAKLEQILNNEKVLMDEVATMKQELNVIKVRVTQSQ